MQMDFRTLRSILGLSILAISMTGCGQKTDSSVEKPLTAVQDDEKQREAKETGIDAYIYAYPLAPNADTLYTIVWVDDRRSPGLSARPT
jgi:hypothetical protein